MWQTDGQTDSSGGAKVGPAGARAPAAKPCAPAVPGSSATKTLNINESIVSEQEILF